MAPKKTAWRPSHQLLGLRGAGMESLDVWNQDLREMRVPRERNPKMWTSLEGAKTSSAHPQSTSDILRWDERAGEQKEWARSD
eukprot:g12217.t1